MIFFQALPVTGTAGKHFQCTHQTISYHMQKTVCRCLKPLAHKVVFRFRFSTKSYQRYFPNIFFVKIISLWFYLIFSVMTKNDIKTLVANSELTF